VSELIPGLPTSHQGCFHQWATLPVALASNGLPAATLKCVDDDPSCDFGAQTGDKACTFRVGMCFNVNNPGPRNKTGGQACTPTDVRRVWLLKPAVPQTTAGVANLQGLEQSMERLGGIAQTLCTNNGPRRNQACAAAADCDSVPGAADGKCRPAVTFAPPLVTQPACTDFFDVVVPLRTGVNGTRRQTTVLTLATVPSNDPVTGQPLRPDTDSLKLTCQPRP